MSLQFRNRSEWHREWGWGCPGLPHGVLPQDNCRSVWSPRAHEASSGVSCRAGRGAVVRSCPCCSPVFNGPHSTSWHPVPVLGAGFDFLLGRTSATQTSQQQTRSSAPFLGERPPSQALPNPIPPAHSNVLCPQSRAAPDVALLSAFQAYDPQSCSAALCPQHDSFGHPGLVRGLSAPACPPGMICDC